MPLSPFLLILLLLTPLAALTADADFNQTQLHELGPGPPTDLLVGPNVRRLRLGCPPTHTSWFLPQSLTPNLQAARVELSPDPASSNYLDVSFPDATDAAAPERATLRGQYTCCPHDRLTHRHLSSSSSRDRLHRLKTPACCPCCPWPEEEACNQLPWNDSAAFAPGGPSCLHVFVYTGVVDSASQQVSPRWGARFLFPCPLPVPPPASGGFPLRIYRQIENIPDSRELWFSSRKLASDSRYDPRIGLCSHHRQLKHYFMMHVCEYASGVKRMLKVRPPSAPPSLPPTVRLILGQQSRRSPLTAVPRLKNGQEIPTFRTTLGSNVAVLCETSYTTMIIIQQPPRLCFRWRLMENDTAADWLPMECLQMRQSSGRRAVYAQHRYHFTVRRPATMVECEVTEISRATEPQRAVVRLEAINATEETLRIVSSLLQKNGSTDYRIFHEAAGENLTTTLFVHNTSRRELLLTFYSYNEIGTNAGCFDPLRSGNETVTHLSRNIDRWICGVKIPQGVQHMLVTLQQGDLQSNISIYTTPQYHVSGLHGFLNHPFNLTCGQHSVNSRKITELFAQSLTSINWLVITDGLLLLNQSRSNTTGNLILPPFVNDSSLSQAPLFSYTTSRTTEPSSEIEESQNIEKLLAKLNDIPLPDMQAAPRNICVSCEAHHTVWTSRSPLVCQRLDLSDDFFTSPLASSISTDVDPLAVDTHLPSFEPMDLAGPDSSITFRVTAAYPAYPTLSKDKLTELTVFAGSRLSLRCAVTLNQATPPGSSPSWPLIVHFTNETTPQALLPFGGQLDFFARPLSTEVHFSTEVDNSTAPGVYSCLSSSMHMNPQQFDPLGLNLSIKPTSVPVIMEPKFPVRYFMPGELIRLVCRATGMPPPLVLWRMTALQNANETQVLRQCGSTTTTNRSDDRTPAATVCNLVLSPPNSTQNITVQCVAVNLAGEAKSSLSLIVVLGSVSSKYSLMFHRVVRSSVFWITFPLVFCFCLFIGLATCIYKKSRKVAIAEKLIQMDNMLYARPTKSQFLEVSSVTYSSNQLFIKQLMPTEEMRKKWCLDRRNLKGLSKPLGTGHYGTVLKGVYVSSDRKNKKSTDDSFFVAVKTPSAELSSLTCFRNELLHLMKLSGGPNIVSLIGCIVGAREDMSDSLLLMEFCPNTSLSEYLVRIFHPRHYQANLLRSVEGNSNTLSTRLSSTTFPYEAFSGSTSSDGYVSVLQPQPPGSYVWRGLYRDSGWMFSRHRRARTGNSFVYQRIDGDYSTFLMGIAQGIARGLEFLSQNFVIHRDIATRNILLDSRQVPKICDFGLAVTVEQESSATDGTNLASDASAGCYRIITFAKQLPFRILPPEALSKQMFYLTSDVWEFGLLLWQMFFLETRKPFESVQTSEALLRLLTSTTSRPPNSSPISPPATLDRPPSVPSGLWTLMCDCWRLEPNQRPSATQVRQRIDDCIALLASAYAPSEPLQGDDNNSDSVSYQILRRPSVTSEMPEMVSEVDLSAACRCTSLPPRSYENVGPPNYADEGEDYLEARESLCSV